MVFRRVSLRRVSFRWFRLLEGFVVAVDHVGARAEALRAAAVVVAAVEVPLTAGERAERVLEIAKDFEKWVLWG